MFSFGLNCFLNGVLIQMCGLFLKDAVCLYNDRCLYSFIHSIYISEWKNTQYMTEYSSTVAQTTEQPTK